jgi:ketopantoate reductase
MKICIYGAGAIGGYLGVELARAGADVSLVARGAHLAAMRAHGLTLQIGGEECTLRRAASGSASMSSGASTVPAKSALTRPRCCRISSADARWKSTLR